MSLSKKTIADTLFGVQVVLTILFTGAQFVRSLTDVSGVSIAYFILATLFLVFNLMLGIGAHRAKPGRATAQAIVLYIIFLIMFTAVCLAVGLNTNYRWTVQDTTTLAVSAAFALGAIGYGTMKRLPIRDPMMLAYFAIASKSLPQLLLVWSILEQGGSGFPLLSIIIGHCSILLRLGQIYFMVKESGWERNRSWLAISEGVNELTWIAVTIAWLAML